MNIWIAQHSRHMYFVDALVCVFMIATWFAMYEMNMTAQQDIHCCASNWHDVDFNFLMINADWRAHTAWTELIVPKTSTTFYPTFDGVYEFALNSTKCLHSVYLANKLIDRKLDRLVLVLMKCTCSIFTLNFCFVFNPIRIQKLPSVDYRSHIGERKTDNTFTKVRLVNRGIKL